MLSLKGCKVVDLAPLEGLSDLQFLFLDQCPVADASALQRAWKKDMDGERRWAPYCQISLQGCPLNDASRKLIADMKKAGARITP